MIEVISKLGGRRYVYALLGLVASFVLCICGKLTGEQFVAALTLLATIYTAANTTQKVKEASSSE
jgi:hypothetical protein